MIKRLTLPLISTLAVLVLSACSESPPPSPEPTFTPSVAPTSTPVPTPSPTPVVPFEDSLSSADLARFQALPVEVQEALIDESLESGNEAALRYLRDMPDDPVPLSAILEPETQTILDSLDEPYRRQLLLEGYPDAGLRHLSWSKICSTFLLMPGIRGSGENLQTSNTTMAPSTGWSAMFIR